jgi:hypothetical protein
MRTKNPDPNGAKLSPEGATSNSPGQASAPPWVLKKKAPCPEWAASQSRLNLVPFNPDPASLPSGGSPLEAGASKVGNTEKVAVAPRARLSGVRRLHHQRASALCQSGTQAVWETAREAAAGRPAGPRRAGASESTLVESVGGTQAAREAARETAGGSPKGETSGSERVNPSGA